jgi:hypothetical protein
VASVEERLARMANLHKDPAKREEAAKAYRELTGGDPPTFEGPVSEGEAPMGAPSVRAKNQPPPIDPAGAQQQSFMGRAADAVGDFVGGPLNAGAAKFNETVSMGMYPKFLDLIGASSPQYRQKLEEDHPIASTVGTGAGIAATAMLPGAPAAIIDRGVASTAAELAPALSRTAGGTIARGATSGALVGGTAALPGSDGTPEGMARAFESGMGPGAAAGGGLTALGVGMQAGSRGIQAAMPRVRDFVRATEEGAYQSPELRGLSKGGLGVREAAENAGDAVLARSRAMSTRDRANYDEGMQPYLESTDINTDLIKRKLYTDAIENRHADTGAAKDPALMDALGQAFEQSNQTKTAKGLLDNLETARAEANFNSATRTPKEKAAGSVYDAMNEGLDKSLPEGARAVRSESRQALEATRRRNDILANTEGDISRGQTADGGENLRVTKEKMVARLLSRIGDTNEPGKEARRYLAELAQQDPEIARQIALVQAKKAQEGTRFSFDPVEAMGLTGTNEAGGFGATGRQLGRFGAGRILEPALRRGGEAAVESGGRMGGTTPLLAAPVDAIVKRRKKK